MKKIQWKDYTSIVTENPKIHPVDFKRMEFILSRINEKFKGNVKGKSLLDCACGKGIFSLFLSNLGINIFGFDLSVKNIETANDNKPDNCDYKVGDIYNIDELYDKQFDIVILSEILEHIHKPEIVLKKLKKITHKDTLFIVMVPNGRGPSEINQSVRTSIRWIHINIIKYFLMTFGVFQIINSMRNKELYPEGGHVKYYNFNQWKTLLEECGFEICEYSLTIGKVVYFNSLMNNYRKSKESCHFTDNENENKSCGFWFSCKFK